MKAVRNYWLHKHVVSSNVNLVIDQFGDVWIEFTPNEEGKVSNSKMLSSVVWFVNSSLQ